MKSVRSYTMIGCMAVVAALSAGLASAQVVTGRFTLPFAANWGIATLPAGDYTFKLDHASLEGTITLYQGTQGVALIKCQGYDHADRTGGSALIVTSDRAGGSPTVRSLRLAEAGVVFSYVAHRPKHGTAPAEKEMAQVIPVTTFNR
jgi:hypothetical protein